MKNIQITFILLFAFTLFSTASNESNPKGVVYGDLFLNANHSFEKEKSSLRMNRLHLGYKYEFSDSLYFNGMIESAREDYDATGNYAGITDLFEFALGFSNKNLKGKIGLIGTELNQLQEKLWQHRYVDKVYADKYGFSPTNDFGAIVVYEFSEALSVDIALTNGEGHKEYETDSNFRLAMGLTLQSPDGLVFRLFGDVLDDKNGSTQTNLIAILGYTSEIISFGLEWNQQLNASHIDGYDRGGPSVYLSYNLNKKYQIFGRYDLLESDLSSDAEAFVSNNGDGQLVIAGLQYRVNQNVVLSLNNRNWISDYDDNTVSYLFFDVALTF